MEMEMKGILLSQYDQQLLDAAGEKYLKDNSRKVPAIILLAYGVFVDFLLKWDFSLQKSHQINKCTVLYSTTLYRTALHYKMIIIFYSAFDEQFNKSD